MYKVGDKFIIEIGGICPECATDSDDNKLNTNLYRIKGFNSLVFDEFGLNKLVPLNSDAIKYYAGFNKELNDEAYQRGLNDAWEAAIKICEEEEFGGLPMDVVEDLFGKCDLNTAMSRYTASEAISKIREYENKREKGEIRIGDEVIWNRKHYIVFAVKQSEKDDDGRTFNKCKLIAPDGNSDALWVSAKVVEKTGRHFPQIEEVLSEMEMERK